MSKMRELPNIVSARELRERGGKKLENMTYYKLETRKEIGIYEPIKNDKNEIVYYALRKVM